ncbi:acyl-CoA carboxylase subunit beta [Chloroflexota bacterium]
MRDDKTIKKEQLAEFEKRRDAVMQMGGLERVERQKQAGKLTARERINLLLDKGTFREIGMFVKNRRVASYEDVPADAVVTGYGKIDGREVCIFSQDFTSMSGTFSIMNANKVCSIMDRAMEAGCPVIALNDSAGARIHDAEDAQHSYSQVFYRNTLASGVIPQICAILGPGVGGAVYSPALMDFIFMIKGKSYAFITGPRVIKAVMGEEISIEELGGASVVQKKAGVACRCENSEEECFDSIKELLNYLPSSSREKPIRIDWGDDPDRIDKGLFDIVPATSSKPYDMHKIIERVFDQRKGGKKNYFEIFPAFATNIITCFSRLNGWSVGIIASQPMSKSGCLDIDASDKASRFIRFCDAFNIPVINLIDVPGYLPGKEQEWGGIIRHGAKMLYAYSEATVPKITVTIRKAYGGSYNGMCSKDLGADFIFCWPSTELAVMGPQGAASIIYRKELEEADDSDNLLQEKAKEYKEKFANPYRAAEKFYIDEVIDPAQTRPILIDTLELLINKVEERPWKKHGVMPT